jgi:hypothetical protein
MSTLRKIAVDILKGKLPAEASDDLAKERLKVCDECEFFGRLLRQCKLCGCFMDLKSKLLEAECPADKW